MTTNGNEWQQVVQRVTTNDKERQRMAASDNELYEWPQVTTNENECQRVTTSDSKWYNEWQRVTMSDNEW